MYVDTSQVPMAFESLPLDMWGHVHVQPTRAFTAALTLMARTGAAGGEAFGVGALAGGVTVLGQPTRGCLGWATRFVRCLPWFD